MLSDKGYKDGSLYSPIDSVAKDNLITKEMASWAHKIRLDANYQRHADGNAPLPNFADAEKALSLLALLINLFLFYLNESIDGENLKTIIHQHKIH